MVLGEQHSLLRASKLALLVLAGCIRPSPAFVSNRRFGGALRVHQRTPALSVLGDDAEADTSQSNLKTAVKEFADGNLPKEDFEKLVQAEEAKAKVKADVVSFSP